MHRNNWKKNMRNKRNTENPKKKTTVTDTFITSNGVGEGGGHSHIPRHVRAPYYWRQRVISGLETVSQGGPQPKHRPPDFDICLYSHK